MDMIDFKELNDDRIIIKKNYFFYNNAIDIIDSKENFHKYSFKDKPKNKIKIIKKNQSLKNIKIPILKFNRLEDRKNKRIDLINIRNIENKPIQNIKLIKHIDKSIENVHTPLEKNKSFTEENEPENSMNENIFKNESLNSSKIKFPNKIMSQRHFYRHKEKVVKLYKDCNTLNNNLTIRDTKEIKIHKKSLSSILSFKHTMSSMQNFSTQLPICDSNRKLKKEFSPLKKEVLHKNIQNNLKNDIEEKYLKQFTYYKPITSTSFKKVGDMKILKVPDKFKFESEKNVELNQKLKYYSNKIVKNQMKKCEEVLNEVYKKKYKKEIHLDNFYDRLSKPLERFRKEDDLLIKIKDTFKRIETGNILIKNNIINTRRKMEKSSLFVNPKFFVKLETPNKKRNSIKLEI